MYSRLFTSICSNRGSLPRSAQEGLTRYVFEDETLLPEDPDRSPLPFDRQRRIDGRDWPSSAETMIGLKRLDNLEKCITAVIRDGVPGDLIETGVWRGGAAIFMRGVLAAYGDPHHRVVWLADSFEGVPKPDPETYPADAGDRLWAEEVLAVDAKRSNGTSRATASWTIGCVSCQAGSVTPCRPPQFSNSPCSGWMAICTSRRWSHSNRFLPKALTGRIRDRGRLRSSNVPRCSRRLPGCTGNHA